MLAEDFDHVGRLSRLWTEEREKRQAAETQARDLTAIVGGLLHHLSESDVPLYRRIGNQRRALAALNHIDHIWSKVLTHEERMTYIDRWRETRAALPGTDKENPDAEA